MSAVPVVAPARLPRRQPAPAPLEIVATRSQRRARPRAAYAVATVIGVFAILLAQLALSIVLSEGAYRITALESQRVELDRSAQVLSESLDALRSPQHLAMNAESLGMVANASPAYLRLADARVLGAPVAAGTGSGFLHGGATVIGNVLLSDVALVTAAALETSTTVGDGSDAGSAGVATAPTATTPITSGAIPSPVSR
ncbi:MAG: hypothetical protein KIT89_03990 [Microcella sp.]|uniref:hypothetical protein n=1 Tax=Microcella sp. TaxID=1913979 RepID=UPI0024C7AD63|nr:hypothetical protein [Microcella sp.]UYN84361.1 MAG: hypothetical protein KIT89_03990 [Microcella sp.]